MKAKLPPSDSATQPAFDKRGLTEPVEVALGTCPACGEPGIPLVTNRPFKFCLRCQWSEPQGSEPPATWCEQGSHNVCSGFECPCVCHHEPRDENMTAR